MERLKELKGVGKVERSWGVRGPEVREVSESEWKKGVRGEKVGRC